MPPAEPPPPHRPGPTAGPALRVVLSRLRCPVCRAGLELDGGGTRCPRGHRHDLARTGQLTLTGGRRVAGDTAEMVAARERFLNRGHFAPISAALVAAVRAAVADDRPADRPGPPLDPADGPGVAPDGLLVDLAAGTGHHLAHVLDALPERFGLAVDSAPGALRRAARRHPRMAAVGADVWRELPLVDGAAAVVLSVFGPRHPDELARILGPGGVLVVVTPTPEHLHELRDRVGLLGVPADKADAVAARLVGFTAVDVVPVRFAIRLAAADVRDVVGMGPSAHHLDRADVLAAAPDGSPAVPATGSVTISTFRAGG